jgi:hypothetical protein
MPWRYLYALGAIIIAFAIFQFYFRYEYTIHSGKVVRIDRLTHQVCSISDQSGTTTQCN